MQVSNRENLGPMSNEYDLELIRSQISLPQALRLLSFNWDGKGNVACLWHPDDHPSMQIFDDHAWCYSCHKWADIFSFTMKLRKTTFDRAVEWLLDQRHIVPENVVLKQPKEYQGPLPLSIARYYNTQLDKERRQYLWDRLITDETIDSYLLGYRPDYQAFTIPYWSGIPGHSDIVSLQYRVAPWSTNQQRKYWWEPGYYRPCVLNQHLINDELVILLFGTVDGLLGAQDGLPIISASGLSTYGNPHKPESIWLRDALSQVKRKIVLPDQTTIEHEAAVKVMVGIGAEVKFFPYYLDQKDYNAYRTSGRSTVDFVNEILEMSTDDIPILERDGSF